jgi:hypothetical protein
MPCGGLYCRLYVYLAARPAQTIISLLEKQLVTNILLLAAAPVFLGIL